MSEIIRGFPPPMSTDVYDCMCDRGVFDTFRRNPIETYDTLQSGVNPSTGRVIKVGGAVYNNLIEAYTVKYGRCKQYQVHITDLTSTNIDEYLAERERLKKVVEEHNKSVDDVCRVIGKLAWGDHVVFDGKSYGVPEFHNRIHRKDDCGGDTRYDDFDIVSKTTYFKCMNCGTVTDTINDYF